MLISITFQGLEGVPLLTHNERLANPMDSIARAMKTISSKRGKTEDDFSELARLEFEGGLYICADGKTVGLPSWNLQRSVQDGARQHKLGKAVERGLTIASPDIVPLTHSGPSTAEAMWTAECFDQRSVKVGTSKVTRTRPRFLNWSATVDFDLNEEQLDLDQLQLAAEVGGRVAAVGDYRPRFGRYEVTITKGAE